MACVFIKGRITFGLEARALHFADPMLGRYIYIYIYIYTYTCTLSTYAMAIDISDI